MCGLNFYLAKRDNHQLKKWIKDSREHIESRGPDNYSELFLESDKIGFSHSRLAIVDLDERSNQPFKYKDYILLFNGEIYNFLKIKRELVNLGYSFKTTSDTEVLIIGYHHFKDEIFARCVKRDDGSSNLETKTELETELYSILISCYVFSNI